MSDTQPVTPDLDSAVAEARSRFVDRRPAGREWAERAEVVLPGGNTRSVLRVEPFPIRITRADGARLWDVDGHEYVDLLGDFTNGLLGHRPVPVLAAVSRALEDGWAFGGVHRDEVHLAELVVGRFPSIDQVRFTNSGTEANLMALAVAIHHTGRRRSRRVRARLSRRRAVVRHSPEPGQRAARLAAPAVQRHRRGRRRVRRAGRRHRGGPRRADAGIGRMLPGRSGVPRGIASPVRRARRVAHLRRGHDVAPGARRRPVAARHHAGRDDARQVPRRRPLVRRLRRPTRGDGAFRPCRGRRAEPRRNVQQQRRVDGRWHRGPHRRPVGGGARGDERPRRPAPHRARRDVPSSRRPDERDGVGVVAQRPRHRRPGAIRSAISRAPTTGGRSCSTSPPSMPGSTSPGGVSSPCRSR